VERAGHAIVRGIERRARRVYAPRLIGPMLPLRQLLVPALEQQMRRAGVVREVERIEAPAPQAPDHARSR
jgi:hypothetical protein